jgi:hypothetical protein
MASRKRRPLDCVSSRLLAVARGPKQGGRALEVGSQFRGDLEGPRPERRLLALRNPQAPFTAAARAPGARAIVRRVCIVYRSRVEVRNRRLATEVVIDLRAGTHAAALAGDRLAVSSSCETQIYRFDGSGDVDRVCRSRTPITRFATSSVTGTPFGESPDGSWAAYTIGEKRIIQVGAWSGVPWPILVVEAGTSCSASVRAPSWTCTDWADGVGDTEGDVSTSLESATA